MSTRTPPGEKIGKIRRNAIHREIFPRLRFKETSPIALHDKNFEQSQKAAITALSPVGGDDGTVLLAVSERIYDTELSRLDGFITRSGFVLGAGGIFGALVVAAGQLGLITKAVGDRGGMGTIGRPRPGMLPTWPDTDKRRSLCDPVVQGNTDGGTPGSDGSDSDRAADETSRR